MRKFMKTIRDYLREHTWRSVTIRMRLIIGTVSIVFLAVGAMGVIMYVSTHQANTDLVDQVDAVTKNDAENILNTIADRQAEILSNYFESLNKNILTLRDYNQNVVSNQSKFEMGLYWDARTSLFRNDKASWDNTNDETASVFIPATANLTDSMISELNALRYMDLIAPPLLSANPDIIAVYFGGSSGYTLYYPNVDLANIIPADFDVTTRPWYMNAIQDSNSNGSPVLSDPYLDAARNGIVITNSAPVYDLAGKLHGVVAQDIQLTRISESITDIRVGDSGYAFLIDRDLRLIAMPESGFKQLGLDPGIFPLGGTLMRDSLPEASSTMYSVISEAVSSGSGILEVNLNNTKHFVVFRSIQEAGFIMLIVIPENEMLAISLQARQQFERVNLDVLLVILLAMIGIIASTLLATINFTNKLTSPLQALTRTAEEMSKGNLNVRANLTEENELGTLASALNSLAGEVKNSIDELEERVRQQTIEAEQKSQDIEFAKARLQRRASQFEAMAQVSRSISSIRDPQELLGSVADLVSEYYGYYHTGVFLIDQVDEYAILTATNSAGGRKMLERQHRLKVGEQGIVGSVAASGKPRIVLNVGEDAVFFNNPDLPETHSEMALPLRSGGKVIGVLDIQSTEVGAFTDEDVQTLNLLAEQVSLAIENARLFAESKKSLNELQMIMSRTTRDSWSRVPEKHRLLGYRYDARGASLLVEPIELSGMGDPDDVAPGPGGGRITVPINLRGEIIGYLIVQSPTDRNWDEDERDIIRAVAERVALSAENARLFEETTQRAERERLVSEITGRIRSHNDPQTMIQTALQELRKALGASHVDIVPKVSGRKDHGR